MQKLQHLIAMAEIAMRPGKRKQRDKTSSADTIDRIKAAGTRIEVEHPFRLFKYVFGL